MKDIGKITKQTEEGDSSILMGMFTKANGEMIRHMVMEYTTTMMAQAIMGHGFKIFKRALVSKSGLMGPLTKGTFFSIQLT